jgi:hypothetical protein
MAMVRKQNNRVDFIFIPLFIRKYPTPYKRFLGFEDLAPISASPFVNTLLPIKDF